MASRKFGIAVSGRTQYRRNSISSRFCRHDFTAGPELSRRHINHVDSDSRRLMTGNERAVPGRPFRCFQPGSFMPGVNMPTDDEIWNRIPHQLANYRIQEAEKRLQKEQDDQMPPTGSTPAVSFTQNRPYG